MQTNIRQWGNSQGLCIPKSMLRQLGWTLQDDVELTISGDRIIIERCRPYNEMAAAFDQIRTLRKSAVGFDADSELQDYLEERYGIK
ncbi:MAG: AbrB/MazE/SpoVT family DNA-binding domain-containing protein [Bacillota bacterium]|nr:AbrB/MazE/SpoVT family DNA-binding domain-containing protein [Bacillota bacterium]